ncbi:MAG: metallophosphoesterase family protein [Bacteroidales bacterium]|nr:metallophosphoesterase family protein [Bacteroidales bacterium]
MKTIGLLSDTHTFVDDKILNFFNNCDEIWHAGDIGNIQTADLLAAHKPLKAVYGNIDGHEIRRIYPEHLRFICEGLDVWITHIGGYPGRYDRAVYSEIQRNPPGLFISGHSHILKVIHDNKLNLLHINPGAAGKSGLHMVRTAVRFQIENGIIKNLELLEIKR